MVNCLSHVWLFVTPWTVAYQAPPSTDFPGKSTGVGCHFLPQRIFPTQGSNTGLPHSGLILYQLSHKGSPRILEWVSYPFLSGSSRPRNWTRVSCISGGFFTNWAIREAYIIPYISYNCFLFIFFFTFCLLFWLGNFHYSIFQITYSLFYIIHSAIHCV